jgi:hypothetical protein
MTYELDKTLSVGTDVATWFLFHPDDLAHRQDDAHDWWNHNFAVSKEFAAGRLIAVGTGKDGTSRVHFTNQGLMERDRTYATKPIEFPLRVRRDRLYLDGGLVLPSQASVVDFGENDLCRASCFINPSERIRLVCRSCCGSQWRSPARVIDSDR